MFTFESVLGDTKVTHKAKVEAGDFFRPAEPVVGRMAQRQWETRLQRIGKQTDFPTPAQAIRYIPNPL